MSDSDKGDANFEQPNLIISGGGIAAVSFVNKFSGFNDQLPANHIACGIRSIIKERAWIRNFGRDISVQKYSSFAPRRIFRGRIKFSATMSPVSGLSDWQVKVNHLSQLRSEVGNSGDKSGTDGHELNSYHGIRFAKMTEILSVFRSVDPNRLFGKRIKISSPQQILGAVQVQGPEATPSRRRSVSIAKTWQIYQRKTNGYWSKSIAPRHPPTGSYKAPSGRDRSANSISNIISNKRISTIEKEISANRRMIMPEAHVDSLAVKSHLVAGPIAAATIQNEIEKFLNAQSRLPPSGMGGFDPRLSPAWAGLQIPG